MLYGKKLFWAALAIVVLAFMPACGGGGGGSDSAEVQTDNSSVVTKQSVVTFSADCPNGGFLLDIGIDDNGNSMLDTAEVDRTESVCNGADGLYALISMQKEPEGSNCALGGQRFNYGLDANGNSLLEISEIDSISYACNATITVNGKDGADGLTTIVLTSMEPAGANCTAGGIKVVSGLDNNKNGMLDATEISGPSSFVCNGKDGIDGFGTLMEINVETAGENCSNGGQKIEVGIDVNHDGFLDQDEIDQTSFICNGIDGEGGTSSLVDVMDEPAGENCANTGKKILSGIDANSNGILEVSEVTRIDYVCNGVYKNEPIQLAGKWVVTNYNNGYSGESGLIIFNEDNTFTIEGGTISVISGCYTAQCAEANGTWEELEDDIFLLNLGTDYSFLTAVNYSNNQITFIRASNLSVFKKVEPPYVVPIASAGPDQTVDLGSTVTLDASASSDANGDFLTYKWKLLSKPQGSTVALSDPTSNYPIFTPDYSGAYTFSLVVNDGQFSSLADTVLITVNSPWSNLVDDFGYTEPFSAVTLDFVPNSHATIYSNSSYGQHGAIIADYANKNISSVMNEGYSSFFFVIDPLDEQHFIKLDEYALWESYDAGVNWDQISDTEIFGYGDTQIDANARFLKFSPDGQSLHIYSNDAGSSVSSPGWLYSVSFDAGATWNAPVGLNKGSGYGPLAFSQQDSSKVYLRSNEKLYRSTDSGLSWVRLESYVSNSAYGNGAFAADPFNSNNVFAGVHVAADMYSDLETKLLKTIDGGDTWNELDIDLLKASPYSTTINGISANEYVQGLIYVALSNSYETAIFRSKDGGSTWERLNNYGNTGLPSNSSVNQIISGSPNLDGSIDLYIVLSGQIFHYIDNL